MEKRVYEIEFEQGSAFIDHDLDTTDVIVALYDIGPRGSVFPPDKYSYTCEPSRIYFNMSYSLNVKKRLVIIG